MLSETLATIANRSCTSIRMVFAPLQFQDPNRPGIALRLAFSMTRSAIGLQATFVSWEMDERL